MTALRREVTVCEVGPRDGLQNDHAVLAPALRAELIDRLAMTGLSRIEVTAFVNPARVPQMAGAEDVVAGITRRPGVTYAGLVLNEQGYDRLHAAELDEVHFSLAASDSFSLRNVGMSVEQAIGVADRVLACADADGIRATVTIGTAFGCPFEGLMDPARVLRLAERLAGYHEIILADTIGAGVPHQVGSLVRSTLGFGRPVGVHLHNTRNTGFANALAAVEAGATVLDASIGGLGGCPFAPRATGNIATEDLVYLLQGEGIETGLDLPALIDVSAWLESVLGRSLEGQVYRAGVFPSPRGH